MDVACGIGSQKASESVHFTGHVKISSLPIQNTHQPRRQMSTLKNMIISKNTVVFKVAALCTELLDQMPSS